MSFRVMKAFEIEANYQKHKERLTAINTFNIKKKVTSTTNRNVEFINSYKKQRQTVEIFNGKEKANLLTTNNAHMKKSLEMVYKRESKFSVNLNSQKNIKVHNISSRSSVRSLNSSRSRIKEENLLISKKIQKTKSQYSKFRDITYSIPKKTRHDKEKQGLVKMLENQLGLKPKVVFPNVKTTTNSSTTINPPERLKKSQTQHSFSIKADLSGKFPKQPGSKTTHAQFSKK